MTSYLFACFNQTCKNLISYCISICGYNDICNCNCGNYSNLNIQFCSAAVVKPIAEININNLTNYTNFTSGYNTGYNNYKDLAILSIISVLAFVICVCLRTKLAIKLANHNIQHCNDHDFFENQNISTHAELPTYNQIDNNPPPTYESIPKYGDGNGNGNITTIVITNNTSSIV